MNATKEIFAILDLITPVLILEVQSNPYGQEALISTDDGHEEWVALERIDFTR